MLVFSSAREDELVVAERRPSQQPAYRSRTRAAFVAKSGSRGKIQLRWVQGLIASSLSQRQMVVPLIEAARPRRMPRRGYRGRAAG